VRALNVVLEQHVRERTAELEMANKELEAFSYSVAHDLRSPSLAIDGFATLLGEMYSDRLEARGQSYLQRVRAGTQRMGQLIDDLLQLSRVTRREMHREVVDLTAMAQEVAADLRLSHQERQVEFRVTPELTVRGDPGLLRIVLENLLGNAWKFTGKRPCAVVELGVTQVGGETTYFVRDNGAGFAMAHAHTLFQPFTRLHRKDEFSGTGIGLAIVARIIQRHGGRT
jgi:light-regulated signal transduction histidine kinase (bacteriophytochrome)